MRSVLGCAIRARSNLISTNAPYRLLEKEEEKERGGGEEILAFVKRTQSCSAIICNYVIDKVVEVLVSE